jgi:hypothetical protein
MILGPALTAGVAAMAFMAPLGFVTGAAASCASKTLWGCFCGAPPYAEVTVTSLEEETSEFRVDAVSAESQGVSGATRSP